MRRERRSFAPGSLSRRLGLAIALTLGLGGIAAAIAAFAYGREAAQETHDALLIGAADQIAGAITIREGAPLADLPASAFDLLALSPRDRVIYAVLGPGGELLTGYEIPRPPARAGRGRAFWDATIQGESWRLVLLTRGFAERSFSGAVQVAVGQTTRARDALARRIAFSALGVAAGAGALMVVMALFAIRSALAPLRGIEARLAARDPKDLTPLDVDVPLEIGGLVAAINRFMARINAQVEGMRTLIGDSAHQLRTPIAALRAQAQSAAETEGEEELRAAVRRIETRAAGLSRLTDQLLSRAMIIHRADSAPLTVLDLRRVAMAAAEEIDAVHPGGAAPLSLRLPEDEVFARGDLLSLTEAAKNLISNALAHGAPPVSVGARIDEGRAVLFVRDEGDGPPEATLRLLGRRFASGGVSPKGAGLGIAIVRAVAAAHGGELRLGPAPGGAGFEAALRLPAIVEETAP